MTRSLILLILPLLVSACTSTNEIEDNSYSLDKYHEHGIKNINLIWEYADYLNTSKIIKNIKSESKEVIPRKESPNSQQLFLKLIDDDAIEIICHDPTGRSEYFDNLVEIYIEPGDGFQGYNKEVVDVMTFGLQTYSRLYFFVLNAIDTTSIEISVDQMNEFKLLEEDFIIWTLDYIDRLDTNTLTESSIILKATYMTEIFPFILANLSYEQKDQIIKRIQYQAKHHKLNKVKKLLTDFLLNNIG
jgi:hypothetical protein